MPAPKIRLVKVVVQPVFVLDHGEHMDEIEHAPIVIPADEWPSYSGQRFPAEVKAWQKQLDAEANAAAIEETAGTLPNRATRRAAAKSRNGAKATAAKR